MLDVKTKVALIKFIGDFISNPDKFRDHIQFTAKDEGKYVAGTFKVTGPLAELFRGTNVQRSVEAHHQIEAR